MAEEPEASAGDERLNGGQQPAEAVKQGETAEPAAQEAAGDAAKKTDSEGSSKQPKVDEAPQKVQDESDESTTPPAQPVDEKVRAKNAFINPQFNGSVSFQVGPGKPHQSINRTGDADELIESHVESGTLTALDEALSGGAAVVAVCGNSGMGKRSACLIALRRGGMAPILQLQSGLGFDDLVASIEHLKSEYENACFLLPNAPVSFVEKLDEYGIRLLTEKLGESGSSRLLITTSGTPAKTDRALAVVQASEVPRFALVAAYFKKFPADEETVRRIRQVAEAHPGTLSRAVIDTMVATLQADPEVSDEDLGRSLPGAVTTAALDQWFRTERSAREVAALACVATCEHAPRTDLDEQVDVLEAKLVGDDEAPGFRRTTATGLAAGLVTTTTRPVESRYGGFHDETVYVLEAHLESVQVLEYLWIHGGAGFRKGLLAWLTTLVGRPTELWAGAVKAAGVLLTIDPRYVETTLIGPWAFMEGRWPSIAAARALGVPTVLDLPSDAGQRLAAGWIDSTSFDLRFCAIVAYGDLLGAWDVESEAPIRLWLEALADDHLAVVATRRLGMLCARGGDARLVRLAVLNLLADVASGRWPGTRREMRQAMWAFGFAVHWLTIDDEESADSLRSLLGENEEDAKGVFVELLARTWSAPYARLATEVIVRDLVRAVEEERIDRRVVADLIRAAKDVARRIGAVAALGDGLRRALALERRDNPDGVVARRLLDQFFPTS